MYMGKKNCPLHYLVTAVSFRIEDIKVCWKLYIDAKFYADHEYAIYFISKVSFTKVITFPSTHKGIIVTHPKPPTDFMLLKHMLSINQAHNFYH